MGRMSRGDPPSGRQRRLTFPRGMQHHRVLERCGLVRSRKEGRVRTYAIAPRPLAQAESWMARKRAVGETRLDQMDEVVWELDRKEREK